MKRNIRNIRSLGTVGAGCTWGMGEFWSLTHEERLDVMDAVAEEAQSPEVPSLSGGGLGWGRPWPIGAHVTHTSAPEMLSLAAHAEGRGYDLLIVAPPYMVTKTEDQVVEYVRLLAEHTNLAIMFYNSPQFGITMSVNGLARLCQPAQRGGRQGGQLQPADFHRGAPDAGAGFHHQHARRMDLLQGAGAGHRTAGDVRQHLRLALRRSRRQQLRALDRAGLPGRLRRGVL